ncbi:MAG: FAD-dependent oxidoreductase [Pseudomonadota bacterium]
MCGEIWILQPWGGGALRVKGGMAALVRGLEEQVPTSRTKLSHKVTSLTAHQDQIEIKGTNDAGAFAWRAERVILALPPRLTAQIVFAPALPQSLSTRLAATPTWMAGQAKMLAVYERPFWRNHGLSGDASSHLGPLVEIHDASPPEAHLGALFGFIGTMGQALGDGDLRVQAIHQLTRLFGPEASTPKHLFTKDWSHDPETAVAADRQGIYAHPAYRPIDPLGGDWAGRIVFAGSEAAPEEGGFLEGALASAEAAVAHLTQMELRHEH